MVPRAWTHLIAAITGEALDPATKVPEGWRRLAAELRPRADVPTTMTDGVDPVVERWEPSADPVDRAVLATRLSVFPLHGLDPHDPRD